MGGTGVVERRSSWTGYASAASWVLVLASPFVFYFAVTRNGLKQGALFIVAFAVLRALPTVITTKREHLWAALRLPAVAVVTALAGVVTGEARALLVLPSLSQAAFASVFVGSLSGTPLVEHFARMQKAALSPAEVRYCRAVTIVWAATLSFAAIVGLALAAWAPIAVWTAFSGVGSYVLVGLVFAGEYVVRKYRFREYGSMPVDRVLSKLFPPNGTCDLALEIAADGRSVTVPIPTDYVFFRGHFPKAPMLPGVVQLSEIVVPIVRQRHPELGALKQLRRVRFKRPVLPGDTLQVELGAIERLGGAGDRADVRFDLRIGAAIVATGVLSFEIARSESAREP